MSEIRKSAASYLIAVGLCLAILTGALKLWKADLSIPLIYGGDALVYQFWVKGVVENGWCLNNEFVGAPFGLQMHDFPNADGLFLLIVKAMSWGIKDYVRVLNIYYILTFPLCVVSCLYVFRRFGVTRGPAVVGALLFAILPYHFLRGQEHLFLSSYFLVPLAVMIVLRVYRDDGPVTFRELGLCVLIGAGGVYYAFFTCYLLMVGGTSAAIRRGRAYPLRSAGLAVAVISASLLVNIAPKFVYAIQHGPNPDAVVRDPAHAELFGLKVAQMLLPVSGHRVPALARLKARYDTALAPLVNENKSSTLGAVGALGFLTLTAGLFWRRTLGTEAIGVWDGLIDLNLASVLLATFGGFGTLFGFLVSSWIRGYCRMSVFIAFFSLFAVMLILTRFDRLAGARRLGWVFHAGLGALLLLGAFDQTTRSFVPKYAETKQTFLDDAEFVGRIEAALPDRAMVFQLPFSPYPEPTTVHHMYWYDHLRGYLHSRGLRWSYGAMRGRYGDLWQSRLAEEPPGAMVRRLALAGFRGIYLDRAGFEDAGAAIEGELTRRLGARPWISRDSRFSFFPLSDYAEALRREYSPSDWAALREASLHPVLVTWGDGFYGNEVGPNGPFRWSDGRGEVKVWNPSTGPRRIELAMTLSTVAAEPSRVRISGLGERAEFQVDAVGRPVRRSVVVPPGTSRIRLVGNGPKFSPPGDSRTLVFRVEGFSIAEPEPIAEVPKAGKARR